jgi:hypothetical protein
MQKPDLDHLEALVDAYGLPSVLDSLAEVCSLKASHLAENWQDTATAKLWDRACRKIMAMQVPLD